MFALAALSMLIEWRVSHRHERVLLRQGAVTPDDPVYSTMRWAYPATFVAMTAEGLIVGPPPRGLLVAGVFVFAAGKLLKAWAIRSLGDRWTFRVHVLPGAPLVQHGPYRLIRHPNYVAVVAELIGFGLSVGAALTGLLSLVGFGWLLWKRIEAEERALGLS